MTGFHMRCHRLMRRARDVIHGGALGPIESVRLVWHSPRGDAGTPAWKTRRASGGGALTEIAVHHFDLLRFLVEADVAEVSAYGRDAVREDECGVVSGRLENGVLFTAEFSERTAHEIEVVVSGRDGWLRVDGLRFDGFERRSATDVPGDPRVRLRRLSAALGSLPEGIGILRRGGDYRDSYRYAWAAFAQAVRQRAAPPATFLDGLRATEALIAAVQSRVDGRAVQVGREAVPPPASSASA
jgi:predicted dehydrogenase